MINTCTVSGIIYNVGNQPVINTFVKAYITTPFFHTDGTYIANYQVGTEVAADGTWSLTLIETETVERTLIIRIEYPGGTQDRLVKEYTIEVPDAPTATLASLVSTEQLEQAQV